MVFTKRKVVGRDVAGCLNAYMVLNRKLNSPGREGETIFSAF
jgi:hypothetical protein